MRKLIVGTAVLATAVAVAPAAAKKPDTTKTPSPYCIPDKVGYKAKGTLVSHTLTQTAGTDTEKKSDDRWSGDITVNLTRANHRAPTGEQEFTVENVRLKVRPKTATPAAGAKVHLFGKRTRFGKLCTASEDSIKIRKIEIKVKKAS